MDLDGTLRAAHAAQDKAALVRLYQQAAAQADGKGDPEAACFYLTHAYVYALEVGAPNARDISRDLAARGREVALD